MRTQLLVLSLSIVYHQVVSRLAYFIFWIKQLKSIESWLGLGSITLIKVFTGLAVLKYVSYTLGPELFGQLGQLMTVVAIISMFAGGGISNGLIKSLAASVNEDERLTYISAALAIYVLSSCFTTVLCFFCSQSHYSLQFFGGEGFSPAIKLLALSQWLVGAYNICQAIFSGYKKLHLFIIVNIAGPLLGTALLFTLLFLFGFAGAAIGLVLLPACGGIVALCLLPQVQQIKWHLIHFKLHGSKAKMLLSYSVLMLVAASSVSVAQIFVRELLAEDQGWQAVGYWFGIIKISDVYMQFIGMLLANYAMPIFSAATCLNELEAEIKKILYPLLLGAALVLMLFYVLRTYAIILLFSDKYILMNELFLPQFIGDYLRIIFSIFVYVFLARGNRLLLILMELLQGIGLFVLAYALLSKQYGLMAPVYAHVLVYSFMLFFSVLAYYCIRLNFFRADIIQNSVLNESISS
jgi:O-antigen/teichoic acid export membrane protein